MIYEVYAGATYSNEYIVLYNNSDIDINLDGYSIQYAASSSSSSFNYRSNLTGTIGTEQYYTIRLKSGVNGDALPFIVDHDAPNIGISVSGGKIALVNGTDEV